MNDFDYDVRQRKALVSSARRRINGSKRKKCSLPSDNLTPGQLAKLSGPCVSVRMNEPMDYSTFRTLTSDLKKEYLLNLQERFRASQNQTAKMMGCAQSVISRVYKELGISAKLPGASLEERSEKKKAWEAFLGKLEPSDNVSPGPELDTTEAEDIEIENQKPRLTIRSQKTVMVRNCGNPEDLLQILMNLRPGETADYEITVTWEDHI